MGVDYWVSPRNGFRCPVCVNQGLRSSVSRTGDGFVTGMFTNTWHDPDGVRHYHDPNGHADSGKCSNDHQLRMTWGEPCPGCDFGHEPMTVTWTNDA